MQAADVLALLNALDELGVHYWLDGDWGGADVPSLVPQDHGHADGGGHGAVLFVALVDRRRAMTRNCRTEDRQTIG